MNFKGVDTAVIYLGGTCNFDCKYCDRDYIYDVVGSQALVNSDHNDLIQFFKLLVDAKDLTAIGFHGGEPLLYIKRIDYLIEECIKILPNVIFHITTNGSKIVENKWFFEKWGSKLRVTLSYDFQYQEINRSKIDIKEIGTILRMNEIGVAFQYVFPIDSKSLDHNAQAEIINTMKLADVGTLNIIPLRHLRGKDKFKVLIDKVNINDFAIDLMRFLQIMYIHGINIKLDGNGAKINKNYLDNHSKLILSPDGYIYPEFDYLEYKLTDYRVGKWKNGAELYRQREEDSKLLTGCVTCPSRQLCGLKYLYSIFDETPEGNCIQFYQIMDTMVKHLDLLKQRTIFEWVGTGE